MTYLMGSDDKNEVTVGTTVNKLPFFLEWTFKYKAIVMQCNSVNKICCDLWTHIIWRKHQTQYENHCYSD